MNRFVVGGIVVAVAVMFLVVSAITSSARYMYTVRDVLEKRAELSANKTPVRVSGFVLGDSIRYDARTLQLSFDMVATHQELTAPRDILHVVADGHVKPDLLQHQAQATVTGRLGADGALYVASGDDSLLLKCPTRYEEAILTLTPASP